MAAAMGVPGPGMSSNIAITLSVVGSFLGLSSMNPALIGASVSETVWSSGCNKEPKLRPGTSQALQISSSGGERDYILFVPPNYSETVPSPVVINYASRGESDYFQEQLTQLNEPFFNGGHIVIYPQGHNGAGGKSAWSGAPYADPDVNDIVFTEDLLDKLQSEYCVDTSRIFATGKSNGGGFVNYLACHPVSSRFAAFAPVAGAFYAGYGVEGANCIPARVPMPFLEIHGYNDSKIPYYGGHENGADLPDIYDFMTEWARRNGCNNRPQWGHEYGGLVNYYDWGCHTYHFAVYRSDNVWESTVSNADTDQYALGLSALNASTVVMSFFNVVPSLPLWMK